MLRILHAGDLHLDSAFSAFSSRVAAKRRVYQCEAFEALLHEAVVRDVALILLAGDCFDTVTPDPDTVRRFFAALEGVGVPVVIAPGNHDHYKKGGFWDSVPLPSNVCLFREERVGYFSFPALNVQVYGYAFTAPSMVAPQLPDAATLTGTCVRILLAHTDITDEASVYAPLSRKALAAAGFAYAALGHVHKPVVPCRLGDTVVAYSGFLAGRGFDEPGQGHANFVEIENGRVTVRPYAISSPTFLNETLDVRGCGSGEEVRARVADYLAQQAFAPDTALRLTLTGEVQSTCVPDTVALLRLGGELALFEIRDETVPLFDTELLAKDVGLSGAFYRALLPRLQSEDEAERTLAAEALRLGFAALSGRELL